MSSLHTRLQSFILTGAVGIGGGVFASLPLTAAAAEFPPCPPPAANEYLLLVRGDSEEQRVRVQDLLPSNSTVLVCEYLEDTVVRAGGFTNLENANAWAQYMTEVEGLQAFVARPAVTPTTPPPTAATPPTTPTASENGSSSASSTPQTETDTPPTTGSSATTTAAATASVSFRPRPLGAGYAILVDHENQPDMVNAIEERIGQAVGLAVYRQRSYLLIAHSPDVQGAASTLQVLSDKKISSFIVDSQEVVMLTPDVSNP